MSLPKVLTANRAKLDQEAMKERNAQFWPISALRILLKCKENPEVSENSMWCDVFLKKIYGWFHVGPLLLGLRCGAEDAWTSREAHGKRDLAPLQVSFFAE